MNSRSGVNVAATSIALPTAAGDSEFPPVLHLQVLDDVLLIAIDTSGDDRDQQLNMLRIRANLSHSVGRRAESHDYLRPYPLESFTSLIGRDSAHDENLHPETSSHSTTRAAI